MNKSDVDITESRDGLIVSFIFMIMGILVIIFLA